MDIESLNIYLKCVEAIMLNENGKLKLLYGDFNLNTIDSILTDKYLPRHENKGYFIDFNSISTVTTPDNKSIVQVDILLALNEPVYLFKLNSTKLSYLIIKLYNKNIKHSILYSYENLQLIESVLRLWIRLANNFEEANFTTDIDYSLISKNQLNKINMLNDELSKSKEIIKKILTMLCSFLVSEINTENLEISLSDSTVDFLSNSRNEIGELKLMLQQAFVIARNLSPDERSIRIKRYFINENYSSNVPEIKNMIEKKSNEIRSKLIDKVQNPKLVTSRENNDSPKTQALLDRYESVAEVLKSKNLPILGKNIAAFCNPPISPPALTDSINKHTDRIKQCLKNHPEKWILIRNNYKPLKNLAMD